MKKVILSGGLFLFGLMMHGQENKAFNHSIGVGAGFTTGYGLSYRFWPKKIGAQATFAPFKDESSFQFNIGVTLLYKLIETEKTNLFLYQGNEWYYKNYELTYYGNTGPVEKREQDYFHNSIGIGIEFIILKRVSFNIMGGYASYENFSRIGFTGETGLYFKF